VCNVCVCVSTSVCTYICVYACACSLSVCLLPEVCVCVCVPPECVSWSMYVWVCVLVWVWVLVWVCACLCVCASLRVLSTCGSRRKGPLAVAAGGDGHTVPTAVNMLDINQPIRSWMSRAGPWFVFINDTTEDGMACYTTGAIYFSYEGDFPHCPSHDTH